MCDSIVVSFPLRYGPVKQDETQEIISNKVYTFFKSTVFSYHNSNYVLIVDNTSLTLQP